MALATVHVLIHRERTWLEAMAPGYVQGHGPWPRPWPAKALAIASAIASAMALAKPMAKAVALVSREVVRTPCCAMATAFGLVVP